MVTAERVDYLRHQDSFGSAPLFPLFRHHWVWQAYLAPHHYVIPLTPPVAETLRAVQVLLTAPDPIVITVDPVVARATIANVTLSVGAPAFELLSTSRPEQEADDDSRQLFAILSQWWHEDTDALSSLEEKTQHSAYRHIVAMGQEAIPYILEELRDRGDHWHLALAEITHESPPVPDGFESNIRGIREAWLQWGRSRA